MHHFTPPADAEKEELKMFFLNEKRYLQRFTQHPDCADPDHPGCSQCEENEDD